MKGKEITEIAKAIINQSHFLPTAFSSIRRRVRVRQRWGTYLVTPPPSHQFRQTGGAKELPTQRLKRHIHLHATWRVRLSRIWMGRPAKKFPRGALLTEKGGWYWKLTSKHATSKLLSWGSLERYGWGVVSGDKPPIDVILLSPSGLGYGVPMLSWAEPYLDLGKWEDPHDSWRFCPKTICDEINEMKDTSIA